MSWNGERQCYINYQITYQQWAKPYEDNIGCDRRRVLSIRTSEDGVHWEPGNDVTFAPDTFQPESRLITPDEEDPAELEFYRMTVFPYGDRWVGMMLNYAASPGAANTRFPWTKHGPQLGGEWWLSDDGIQWRRPFRHVHAPGQASSIASCAPMRIGNSFMWIYPDGIYGVPAECLFYAGSFANAEFSTAPFAATGRSLALHASFGFHEQRGRGMRGQGYIMAELRSAEGDVLPGYEKERCIILDREDPASGPQHQATKPIRLAWEGRTAQELSGVYVQLRLYLRDARIYSLIAE